MAYDKLEPEDPRLARDRVLATDADLQEVIELLLQTANQRQVWLFMLDEQQRLAGPLMPMDGYPETPDELVGTDDLGLVSFPRVFVERAGVICEAVGGSAIVLVWERRGPEKFTADDRAWARALAHEAGEHGPRLRAQFVLHNTGLRQITPDDYA